MIEKDRRLKITAAIIGALLSFVVLEASLRLLRHPLMPWVGVTHNPCIIVEDKVTGYRYKPNSTAWLHRNFEMDNIVEINSIGFHDVEHPEKSTEPNRRTILALGDSFTASVHVPIADTWTQVLERELQTTSVVNLGLSGSGTDVHLALLKENLPKYRPDTVILAYFQNDIDDIRRKMRYIDCHRDFVLNYEDQEQKEKLIEFVDENYPTPVTRWLFDNSFAFRVAIRGLLTSGQLLRNNRLSPSSIGLEVVDDPTVYHDLDELMTEFIALSGEWDFRLIVIPVPSRVSPDLSMNTLQENASTEVRANLEIVDILPELKLLQETVGVKKDDMYWRYDGHFNAKGNELFGLAIAKVLEPDVAE